MFKSRQEDYLNPSEIELNYIIPNLNPLLGHRFTFKYCEVPAFGCGKNGTPVIACDDYLDLKQLKEIEEEFKKNIERAQHRIHHMIPFGLLPQEINQQKCLDSILTNLAVYDPEKNYLSACKNARDYHELKHLIAKKFNLNRPWKDVIHLKKLKSFFEKNQSAEWNDVSHMFPKLVRLVEGLPFKSVGYVMVMRRNENSKLDIHRDIYPRNHSCHHINIALDQMPKSFFIYDAIEEKKYYKNKETRSYFFNECDLHGADPVPHESLTLRVDGVFTNAFAQQMGLEYGVTFDWSFDRPQNFFKARGKIKITEETDI